MEQSQIGSAVLALSFVPGLASGAVRGMLDEGHRPEEIPELPDDVLGGFGLRARTIAALRSMQPYREEAARQLQKGEHEGVHILTLDSPDYPERLRGIWSPPLALYIRGELHPDDATAVAIVGTRSATSYGRLTAERYAARLATAGVTVLSGLARGIDTWAHREALRSGGRTIAVVASGLDRIQPWTAAELAGEISSRGAVISEYRFGTRALRPYFPQRNRIISGLARGVLLVESGVKGGGMITARYAFEHDRDLFALPGPITSPKSAGPNMLIRTDRARLTESPEDLMEALGLRIPEPPGVDVASVPDGLSLFEQQVWESLGDVPLHVDEIASSTGLGSGDLLVILLSLEFRGLVRQMAGRRFLRSGA